MKNNRNRPAHDGGGHVDVLLQRLATIVPATVRVIDKWLVSRGLTNC